MAEGDISIMETTISENTKKEKDMVSELNTIQEETGMKESGRMAFITDREHITASD